MQKKINQNSVHRAKAYDQYEPWYNPLAHVDHSSVDKILHIIKRVPSNFKQHNYFTCPCCHDASMTKINIVVMQILSPDATKK